MVLSLHSVVASHEELAKHLEACRAAHDTVAVPVYLVVSITLTLLLSEPLFVIAPHLMHVYLGGPLVLTLLLFFLLLFDLFTAAFLADNNEADD